jgi:hypothetical protein
VNKDVSRMNYVGVALAVIAAAVVSSVWYSPFLFGKQWMELRSMTSSGMPDTTMPVWKMLVDLVRELIVTYVLAQFIARLGIVNWRDALNLGFWVWLGFPLQMLVGASLWDNKPWMLAPIHAGDWLIKMLLMSLILSQWPRISKSLALRTSF